MSEQVGPFEEKRRFARAASLCERCILLTGRFFSWMLVLLALVIVVQVTLRYAFDRPLNLLAELQWHFYALIGVFGISYTMATNAHVRVDLFYSRFSERKKRAIDALGLIILVIPLGIFLLIEGINFVIPAYELGESSPEADGLPYRWLIKAVIPVGAFMLVLESLARLFLTCVGTDQQSSANGRTSVQS